MSMTSDYIDSLTTQAQAGDAAAQETLAKNGLWRDEREMWETFDVDAACAEYDQRFGFQEGEENFEDFDREDYSFDYYDDAYALASAGHGTDEDYGFYGYEDEF